MKIQTEAILRLRDHLLAPLEHARSSNLGTAATEATLRRIEPFAEIMFVISTADTEFASTEKTALLSALELLCDGTVARGKLQALLEGFESVHAEADAEARIATAAARFGSDRDDREMAFLLAAAVAMADDHFEHGEREVMELVRGYLGITEKRMSTLLEGLT